MTENPFAKAAETLDRVERQLGRMQGQLSALDAISDLLNDSEFNLDSLLQRIAELAAEAMGAKGSALRLLDDHTGELVTKAAFGVSDSFLEKGPILLAQSVFRDMIDRKAGSRSIEQIADVTSDPRIQYPDAALEEGIRSLLVGPMVSGDRLIGTLSIYMEKPRRFDDAVTQTFRTLANHAAVAISLARLHRSRLEYADVERELAIASSIRTKLMPDTPPQLKGYDLEGVCRSCEGVGGDFFDFISLPNDNLGIALGEGSERGVPGALMMATVRTALRVQAEHIYDIREVVARVNRLLVHDVHQEESAALFFGVLNAAERVFTYVNAGEQPPLLVRGGDIRTLEAGGPPLGIYPSAAYEEEAVALQPGDLFVIHSDGFDEVRNGSGEPFGERRIQEVARRTSALPSAEILKALDEAVVAFRGGLGEPGDDRTAVVLKVL